MNIIAIRHTRQRGLHLRVLRRWKQTAGEGSKHNDPRAPAGREERKAWLKAQMEGYSPVSKNETSEQIIKRCQAAPKDVPYILKSTGRYNAMMNEEKDYLDNRRQELQKLRQQVAVGFGGLVTLWMLYTVYSLMTEQKPQHPAASCYIGTTVELKIKKGDKTYQKPIVLGLFTQRAPAASANLVNLIETGKLAGTEFFQIDRNAVYGGITCGGDARDGLVHLPGDDDGGRKFLPPEDPELPPFKYAVVSCAKSFYRNSGMTSTFGILLSDNPKTIGNRDCPDYQRVSRHNSTATLTGFITGRRRVTSREDLDITDDGAYVFAVVIDGRDVVDHLIATTKSKPPMFKPSEEVIISSCKVLEKNLPGKLEVEVVPQPVKSPSK